MPYRTIEDLPKNVKEHLPKKAQDIYMKAFNNAYEQYSDPKKRKQGGDQEQISCKVAWSAVKKSYFKDSKGKWKRIS